MWSGFSSEIETVNSRAGAIPTRHVACGAASRLRLKRFSDTGLDIDEQVACGAASRLRLKPMEVRRAQPEREVACGAASRLRLKLCHKLCYGHTCISRMWSGFSSEIETCRLS